MYVLVLHVTNFAVIKLAVMFIKQKCFIFDKRNAEYSEWLVCCFNPPVSINKPVLCVVDFSYRWDAEVEIFLLILW